MIIGERLKKARLAKGLTLQKLGDKVGLSKATLSCYENETRSPQIRTVKDLMGVLGVSADYLLGTDIIASEKDTKQFQTITKEEMYFLNEIRKNRIVYEMLFQDPKRGIELIYKKLG